MVYHLPVYTLNIPQSETNNEATFSMLGTAWNLRDIPAAGDYVEFEVTVSDHSSPPPSLYVEIKARMFLPTGVVLLTDNILGSTSRRALDADGEVGDITIDEVGELPDFILALVTDDARAGGQS